MMDVLFYRDAVLEIILGEQHIAREVYELRCNLFLRAAKRYFLTKSDKTELTKSDKNNSEVLEPFPHCFFDFATKNRRYDELESCIASIPELLSEIEQHTTLPELTWELLHWIFTNPLNIKVVKESEVSEYLTDELRQETKLMSIPYPSPKCHIFKITHQNINSTNKFLQLKSTFGSFYAYHGSPGHNFHSIIHRGLRCSLNTRRAYGPGTYLTTYLDTARSYATQYGCESISSIRYCVAIVEVIKHPSVNVIDFDAHWKKVVVVNALTANVGGANNAATVDGANNPTNSGDNDQSKFDDTSSKHRRYYVVNSDDLMRLKHLLVYY